MFAATEVGAEELIIAVLIARVRDLRATDDQHHPD